MSSLYQSNQNEAPVIREEMTAALENRDREIYALRQQLQALKTLYKNLKIQAESTPLIQGSHHSEYSKQRIEKLMAALAERERQMRLMQQEFRQQLMGVDEECQKERLAKQHALNEVSALHGQLESLKEKINSNQTVIKSQQNQIQSLHHENALAASQLQMAAVVAMDKDILQNEYEKLKAILLNADRKIESALLDICEHETKLFENETKLQSSTQTIELLEKSLLDAEMQLQSLQQEKIVHQENASKALASQEDAEAQLKVAHHHLAKKVKEATTLTDRNRDLEIQIDNLVKDICSVQRNHSDLLYHFDERMDEEGRRQEHLKNTLNETESLAGAWERKYFEIYDQYQETDQKLKEFEKIQEKITHMKSMWMGFGEFFGEARADLQESDTKEKAFTSQSTPIEKTHASNEHYDTGQTPLPFSL
jgi:chromosome segregation ATPase